MVSSSGLSGRETELAGVPIPKDGPREDARRGPVRIRRPVGVLVSRFPLVTETFVLREIDEMERQGQPVLLAPLIRERGGVVHPAARRWIDRALDLSFLSPAVAASNLRAARRDPTGWFRTVARTLWIATPSWNFLVRTAALLPESVHLAERLRELGIRHVHAHFATHPTTAALIAEGLGAASFGFTVHAHDLFVCRTMLGEKVRRAELVRAISAFNRDFLVERHPEAASKTAVIHVGIDPDRRPPVSGPAGTGPKTILCVAGLKPYKGVSVLVDACARLHDRGRAIRCVIVGEGPDRPAIERRIRAAEIDVAVDLLGARSEEEVARWIAEADVCVAPSVVAPDGQMDGIPVFLMEAMAAARPVVASALSGIPELVEDGESGLLVPPGEAEALAGAIGRVLDDPDLARRLGGAGRDRVRREFDLSKTTALLIEAIDRANPPPDPAATALVDASGWEGFDGAAVGVRRIHRRRDSTVLELLVADGGSTREVVLKSQRSRPGESRPPRARAARERQILEELGRWLADDEDLGVPRVLHHHPDSASLVLERCPGRSLDQRIRRARLGSTDAWRSVEAAAAMSGRWLARFQARSVEGDREKALADLLSRAEADLESAGLPDPDAARDRLRRLATAARPRLRVAPVHGDFWPGNLFVDGERVAAIDFEGARTGLAWEEPAYWLVHAELFLPGSFLRSRCRDLGAAFLEAWLDGAPYDPAAHRLCRSAAALRALAAAPPARGLAGRWRRRTLRRIAAGAR